jgi:hypothetical protein
MAQKLSLIIVDSLITRQRLNRNFIFLRLF